MVLDDPVVHDGDVARDVRMRIALGRRAVRCPARVRNAGLTAQMLGGALRCQLGDAARSAQAPELKIGARAVHHRDAGRIVAPVLEAAQAVDQQRDDVAARSGADDAAHPLALLRRLPSGDGNLPRARQRELPGGRVFVDGRACADIRALCKAYRRHQRGVRADEAVILDHGAVLRRAVIVAGDGAGADVDPRAELGVANIGGSL